MPHVPLHVSDKFKGKAASGLFGDVVMEIDWSVGQILDALDRHQLADRTLVIFTSDNGPWLVYGNHGGSARPLREGKLTTFDGGVREPCIMRWPGHIPADTVCDEPVMTIDLLPTIAHLAGAEVPQRPRDRRPRHLAADGGRAGGQKPARGPVFLLAGRIAGRASRSLEAALAARLSACDRAGPRRNAWKGSAGEVELAHSTIWRPTAARRRTSPPIIRTSLRSCRRYAEQAREDLGDRSRIAKGQTFDPPAESILDPPLSDLHATLFRPERRRLSSRYSANSSTRAVRTWTSLGPAVARAIELKHSCSCGNLGRRNFPETWGRWFHDQAFRIRSRSCDWRYVLLSGQAQAQAMGFGAGGEGTALAVQRSAPT